jgi:hypothetical protein
MHEPKRIICWDLEAFHMNWDAGVAVLFCMCWKVVGEPKVYTESVWAYPGKDALDDGIVCERIRNILETADLWVTYNGLRFDVPFLQTRLLANDLPVLAPIAHKDLYYTAKFKLKLARNSLLSVQNFLKLDNHKTPVDLRQWIRALAGDKKAQKEIIIHCQNDVLVLEECYLRLRPLMLSHPRLHEYGSCNKCGGKLLKNKVYYTAAKNPKITLQCQNRHCRGYETRQLTSAELKQLV